MTKIVKTPIYVNVTHMDDPDVLLEAWKASRPSVDISDKDKVLNEILSLDLPVLEMVHFTLHCKVPVILREIITTLRDHIMWARTSRVDNITEEWHIYDHSIESEDDEKAVQKQIDEMNWMINTGASQDLYRVFLPLTYMTEFTFKVSLRTLGKLISHLFWISNKYSSLGLLYQDFTSELINSLPDCIYKKYFSDAFALKHINFNNFNSFDEESVYKDNNILSFNIKGIPIGLRAQLIRSRNLIIADNLLDKYQETVEKKGIADNSMKLDMSIASSKQFFLQLISKRNCWLAQKDLWEPILHLLTQELGDEVVLPCNGGHCPFNKDCQGRLIGLDPGVPCPMNYILEIEDSMRLKKLSKSDIEVIQQYALGTNRCSSLVKASNMLPKVITEHKGE